MLTGSGKRGYGRSFRSSKSIESFQSCFVRQECKGATGADKDEIDQFEISGDAAPPEEVDKCDVIVQVKWATLQFHTLRNK